MRTAASLQSALVAHRSPSQIRLRRRIEGAIGIVAPLLDLVLFAGDKVSRVAGRNDLDPEPPRRLGTPSRTRIGATSGHDRAARG
jgi:hypothetical protein